MKTRLGAASCRVIAYSDVKVVYRPNSIIFLRRHLIISPIPNFKEIFGSVPQLSHWHSICSRNVFDTERAYCNP
jgi:hypothetical protein